MQEFWERDTDANATAEEIAASTTAFYAAPGLYYRRALTTAAVYQKSTLCETWTPNSRFSRARNATRNDGKAQPLSGLRPLDVRICPLSGFLCLLKR